MSSEPRSSTDPGLVIDAVDVSKRYLLGEREQYQTLRDVMAQGLRRTRSSDREELWAVRDVSFTVSEGEVVGIIGRNGAGKSTLLKILSRITNPSEGEIRVRGRIGSLLEVGSGFHPELTGIENVYLNGAILGMTRNEITAKLDEILAFAEMEQFATTPVKHYSVGMFMRLAFAVAAHLESEILIVDEVLAVGDARFQAKCLSKMGEVARSGRSVLFVSHNLEATLALCDRGILLEKGQLVFDGPTAEAVELYRKLDGVTTRSGDQVDLSDLPRQGTANARFTDITVTACGGTGAPCGGTGAAESETVEADRAIRSGDSLQLDLGVTADEDLTVTSLGLTFSTEGGTMLLNLDTADGDVEVKLEAGKNLIRVTIPSLVLADGRYRLGLRLANPVTTRIGSGAIDLLDPALVLQVDDRPPSDHEPRPPMASLGSQTIVPQGAGSLVQGSMLIEQLDH